jgi:hypothetical protein
MAIRRENKEEKIKKERDSKSSDEAVADPPTSKKEPLVENVATSESESTGQEEAKTSSQKQQKQQIANRVLEETKQNIKKTAKEARDEIPAFTKDVNSFQDQNIQAGAEIAENYIEVQRQLINSIQTSWIPYLESTATLFWNSFLSPQRIVELYANSVAGFAEVWILANRTINNYFLENMETLKNNMEQAKRNSNDLARACMNFAKLGTKERDVIDTKSHVSEGDVTTVETRSE